MMDNYISTNKVKQLKQYCFQTELGVFPSHDYFVRVADLLNIPIVETEPAIHAYWVTMSDEGGLYYCCSNCGEDLPRYYTERPTFDNPFPNMESIDKTPRCPNCGAKMDSEVEK